MFEVEAKAALPDPVAAKARAATLGGQRLGREEQRDTYWAHPLRDFAATDEALRVRESWGAAELTYKGPKLDATTKTREERTVKVEPPEELGLILERLGFRRVAEVAKWREAWKVRGLEVDFDEVEGLGAFVEVEAHVERAEDVAAAREQVLGLLEELGGRESLRTSYLEMLLAKRAKP